MEPEIIMFKTLCDTDRSDVREKAYSVINYSLLDDILGSL